MQATKKIDSYLYFPISPIYPSSSLYISLYCDRATSLCSRSSAIDLHTSLSPGSGSIRYWPSGECAAGADQIVATGDHDQVDRVELDVVLDLVGVPVKADCVVGSTPSSSLGTLICAISSRQLNMYFSASLDLVAVSASCSSGVLRRQKSYEWWPTDCRRQLNKRCVLVAARSMCSGGEPWVGQM